MAACILTLLQENQQHGSVRDAGQKPTLKTHGIIFRKASADGQRKKAEREKEQER